MHKFFLLSMLVSGGLLLRAQSLYLGADLSYVNELEDCGAEYQVGTTPSDPYAILADRGANLVRLRLWHTPSWYDNLNAGQRYSDLADVKRSMARARAVGAAVLLDFHLSDNWADPGKQVIPAAWAAVVDDLPTLQDSLYNYLYNTLLHLHQADLLPELVQIGNETNRGILLTQADNDQGWQLDWPRNAALFQRAIGAVRTVAAETGKDIGIMLHVAGPDEAAWLLNGFWENGVRDFDYIGLSYYPQWHDSVDLAELTAIIRTLHSRYPAQEIMIVETGVPWTTQSHDNADNILNRMPVAYGPVGPQQQLRWLTDLTQAVINGGGRGVVYWEPAWISTSCRTQWARGSHYENATFFDFDGTLLENGGVGFYRHDYQTVSTDHPTATKQLSLTLSSDQRRLHLQWPDQWVEADSLTVQIFTADGRTILQRSLSASTGAESYALDLPEMAAGAYSVVVVGQRGQRAVAQLVVTAR